MLPGFSGLLGTDQVHGTGHPKPAVKLAGLWEIPPVGTCRYVRTDTFCTGLVEWCKEVYTCWTERSPIIGEIQDRTPYPCGVCVGVSDPSDW
jgi:hypothetical protein